MNTDHKAATVKPRNQARFNASSGNDNSSRIGTARSSTSKACNAATPAMAHFWLPSQVAPATPLITAPATSTNCASNSAGNAEEKRDQALAPCCVVICISSTYQRVYSDSEKRCSS
ncbi:hypothetical protein D3C71_859560 [compost metagenome]